MAYLLNEIDLDAANDWDAWDIVDNFLDPMLNAEDWMLMHEPASLDSASAFRMSDVPRKIRNLLKAGGVWHLAIQEAIKAGICDANRLTDMIFYIQHPERKRPDGTYRPLHPSEPKFKTLAKEWQGYQTFFVLPLLRKLKCGVPLDPIPTSRDISYPVAQGREYGGKWKTRRPPGLPVWVRQASRRGAALPHVQRLAQAQGLGSVFVKTLYQMARTESGGTFALPANKFDARPPWQRPPGKGLITAWGVFQFNRDAWTPLIPTHARSSQRSWVPQDRRIGCKPKAGCVLPWGTSALKEIERPILKYAELFRRVRHAGGSNLEAARGLRLWHISPAAYSRWLALAKRRNFDVAWRSLSQRLRIRIHGFLRQAGVQ